MESKLLTLWNHFPSGSIKKEEIAKKLDLSMKQTARYLQKWAMEGWFSYTAGRGRGNASKLEWLKDVEEIYEEKLLELIENESIESVTKFLLFDWSAGAKNRLINKFQSKFGFLQNAAALDKLLVPRKYPFVTMHPLEAADVHSANLVANVFNRLVSVDSSGKVSPELAHSWVLEPAKLRLYLKKDVKFHDGSLLTAENVAACLNRLRTQSHFTRIWEPVTEINAVNVLTVDLLFPGGCSYCLQMLGMMNSSIYNESKRQLYGTGSFYVEENTDLKTSLVAFKDHFQGRPLLDAVEFFQVPQNIDFAYRTSSEKDHKETFQFESDSGFGAVIMNAFRDSDIRRKEVRDYLHYIIAKHREKIREFNPKVLPNHKSCLSGFDQKLVMPKIERPHFNRPLVIKTTNFLETSTQWLEAILEKEGIPFEIEWMSFEDHMFNSEKNRQADLFIHGEIFEMNQDFSFYYFLKNGYSPLSQLLDMNPKLSGLLEKYAHTPFDKWTKLNLKVERALMETSVMIPLYYEKKQIPFSVDLMNITISHFGYVDLSKLWVRPDIE